VIHPDGWVRYVETVSEAVRDETGRTVRSVGAIQDVSELTHAQEALRGSQEQLQLALQATGLGPWDWDLTTNTVQFWPEWKRQIGYEPDELPNRYEEWECRLHPDDQTGVGISTRNSRARSLRGDDLVVAWPNANRELGVCRALRTRVGAGAGFCRPTTASL
jgi:PAS domain-containing protein